MNRSFSEVERRRVRADEMAQELRISIRRFREIHTMGLPHTQVGKTIWYEPIEVHKWLDRFARKGGPGVKRVKGLKVAESTTVAKLKEENSASVA
jgi:hypothetical protein